LSNKSSYLKEFSQPFLSIPKNYFYLCYINCIMELIYLFAAFGVISLAILIYSLIAMHKENHTKK